MIDWKKEVNQSLRKVEIERELNYSDSVQLIIELYTKHKKSLLWLQNCFFNNRVSWFGIRRLLLDERVKLRSKGGLNRPKFECPIDELKNSSLREIGEKYGVSSTTILKRRKEHGIRKKCFNLRHRDQESSSNEGAKDRGN